eukprot:comp11941_c0_seq1/m.6614 comp11941_c0_seq1/g.6614  ORF comp11941_c0_seq1/g.6614 comp11941_c0_seq1/m.6614 type:complete len:179 (-) comp11941_c0_seq1:453-989(-)
MADDEVMDDGNFYEEEDDSTRRLKSQVTKKKGRGFSGQRNDDSKARYESLDVDSGKGPGPQRSVEGWIVIATGIHEEAQEEHIMEKFGEYGEIKNLHLNLDRRTGFVKGYALIEYETFKEAQAAIDELNGTQLFDTTVTVDWAFVRPPAGNQGGQGAGRRGGRGGGGGGRRRARSPSP